MGAVSVLGLAWVSTAPALEWRLELAPRDERGYERAGFVRRESVHPTVALVMLKVTVQLPLAGIVIPVKLSAVVPATKVLGVVPVQVPPTAPPAALMFTSVSVNAAPVKGAELALVSVRVTTDVPPA